MHATVERDRIEILNGVFTSVIPSWTELRSTLIKPKALIEDVTMERSNWHSHPQIFRVWQTSRSIHWPLGYRVLMPAVVVQKFRPEKLRVSATEDTSMLNIERASKFTKGGPLSAKVRRVLA